MRWTLTSALVEHSMRAMDIFDRHGVLTPKLWVVGRRVSMIAEPDRPGTYDLPELNRTELLAAMILHCRARFAGMSAEVWTTSDPSKVGKRLGPLAEVDPSIRTGLVILGIDIKHEQANGALCEPHLDDHGEQRWHVGGLAEHIVQRHVSTLEQAARWLRADSPTEVAERVGWTLVEARRG
jgi:hypothetical protein